MQAQGQGVSGLEETREAPTHGQGDVLLLADEALLDEQRRNDLVRLATLSGAGVETVKGHAALQEMGGVGVLLRYHAPRV